MKKGILSFLLVVTVSVLLVGCGGKKGLVGQWQYESGSGYIYTFNEDKTCSYDAAGTLMECTYEVDGEKLSILYKGSDASFDTTYSVEGDILYVKDSFGSKVKYEKA